MSEITYTISSHGNELYHYGIKGMKWGIRKKPQSYVKAKKARKDAFKEYKKSTRGFRSFGIEGIAKANKAQEKYVNADLKFASERVKYKTSKAKNKEKTELNEYSKQFNKSGLPGSALDRSTGNRSTKLYDQIKREKGRAYADKAVKKYQNRAVATLVGTVGVVVGAQIVKTVLDLNSYD